MKLFLWGRIELVNEVDSQDSYAHSGYSILHQACSHSRLVHFFIQRIFSHTTYLTPPQLKFTRFLCFLPVDYVIYSAILSRSITDNFRKFLRY